MITTGEFVIVAFGDDTPVLVKIKKIKDTTLIGNVLKDGYEDYQISFTSADVVVNLGKTPKIGVVYKVKVEPLYTTMQDPDFGTINIFMKMSQEALAKFRDTLDDFYKILHNIGQVGVPCVIELRAAINAVRGHYAYMPKEEYDTLCVRCSFLAEDWLYFLCHEYGHGVYFRWMPVKLQNKWVSLYHEYVTPRVVGHIDLKAMLRDIGSFESTRDYAKTISIESKAILSAVLQHIARVHKLKPKHLDSMLLVGEPLEEYWPESIEYSLISTVLTKYATKSPEEFFAEAYAIYIGKPQVTLPQEIVNLLEFSFSHLIKG